MQCFKSWLWFAVSLVLCLANLSVVIAQTDVQQSFIQDSRALADKRGLKFIAELPRSVVVNDLSTITKTTWRDEADIFALKWQATYQVSSGFLIVGRQYANAKPSNSQSYLAYEKSQEPIVSFLEQLDDAELRFLQQDGRIPLSSLSPMQREQLSNLFPSSSPQNIGKVTEATRGYVRILISPSVFLFSNGRNLAGLSSRGGKIVFDSDEEVAKPSLSPKLSEAKIEVKSNVVSVSEFARLVVTAIAPTRKIVLDKRIQDDTRSIYLSDKVVPFDAAWDFIIGSLDFEIRPVGDIYYVAFSQTLFSEKVEQQNADYIMRTIKRIKPSLQAATLSTAGKKTLWEVSQDLFLAGRPIYRVELSDEIVSRLTNLNSNVKLALDEKPKIAVGPTLYIDIAVTIQAPEVKRAATAIILPSPWPVDDLAFNNEAPELK